MKQRQADIMYLRICQVIADQSYAKRAKVGAVIVKDNNILSFGMNGTPSGMPNECEYQKPIYGRCDDATCANCLNNCEGCNAAKVVGHKLSTKPEVLHAESNAFMKLARSGGFGCDGATIYVTYSPCIECAKMIVQAGIKRVVYLHEYRDTSGFALLDACKVEHEQIPLQELIDSTNDVMFE